MLNEFPLVLTLTLGVVFIKVKWLKERKRIDKYFHDLFCQLFVFIMFLNELTTIHADCSFAVCRLSVRTSFVFA